MRAAAVALVYLLIAGRCALIASEASPSPTPPAARTLRGAYPSPFLLSPACKASAVADLDARVASPGYVARDSRDGGSGGAVTTGGGSGGEEEEEADADDPSDDESHAPNRSKAQRGDWGPPAATFAPAPAAPAGCDPTAWAEWRLLGAAQRLVAQGFCYCHHLAPYWMPPANERATCSPACPGARRPRPYQGVDCSHFTAYVYNLAFGLRFAGHVSPQACAPGGRAPGRLLPLRADQQDSFRPGDLLYIATSKGRRDRPPARVAHVVMWTGLTVDFNSTGGPLSADTVMHNLSPAQARAAAAGVAARRAAGLPVYLIADSHNTGPNYRPFAGWYSSHFSHARRVVIASADEGLPNNDAAVADWDGKTCTSNVAPAACAAAGAGGRC